MMEETQREEGVMRRSKEEPHPEGRGRGVMSGGRGGREDEVGN